MFLKSVRKMRLSKKLGAMAYDDPKRIFICQNELVRASGGLSIEEIHGRLCRPENVDDVTREKFYQLLSGAFYILQDLAGYGDLSHVGLQLSPECFSSSDMIAMRAMYKRRTSLNGLTGELDITLCSPETRWKALVDCFMFPEVVYWLVQSYYEFSDYPVYVPMQHVLSVKEQAAGTCGWDFRKYNDFPDCPPHPSDEMAHLGSVDFSHVPPLSDFFTPSEWDTVHRLSCYVNNFHENLRRRRE